MINRRGLITGLISLAAAPAIVRYSNLMPVKVVKPLPFKIYPYQHEFLKFIEEYKADLDMITGVDVLYGKLQLNKSECFK